MADIVTTQITASALVVYGIELMKKTSWLPWITRTSDNVNRTVSTLLAAATALGIHSTFDASRGTLVITGLTMASLLHFGLDWLRSFVFQQMIYKGVIKPQATSAKAEPIPVVAPVVAEPAPLQRQAATA